MTLVDRFVEAMFVTWQVLTAAFVIGLGADGFWRLIPILVVVRLSYGARIKAMTRRRSHLYDVR